MVQFRQAVGTGGILTAEGRLERILNAAFDFIFNSIEFNMLSVTLVKMIVKQI